MSKEKLDPRWVPAARAGDQEAITQLYNHTYQKVYLTIQSMIRTDEDTVLDLLQDTFIKAFQNLDKLDDPNKFGVWIASIARHTTLDYLKKSRDVLFTDLSGSNEDASSFEVEDTDFSHLPDEVIDQKETARLLRQILDALPKGQRVVVSMFYYQDLKIKEIAEILGQKEGTVKAQLNNARKNIEAKIRKMEKENGFRLYTLAPLPFFIWLMRKAEKMDISPNAAARDYIMQAAIRKSSGAAVTGTSARAAASKSTHAATAAAKAASGTTAKGLAGKITAGVLTVSLLGGGIAAGINTIQSASKPADVPTIMTEVSEPEPTMPVETEFLGYATALEAYANLLQNMIDNPDILMQCSHLVDLDKDGTDELIVLSSDHLFELFTFKDGDAVLLSSHEMDSVFMEDWQYYGRTYAEIEQSGEPFCLQAYLSEDNTIIWVETTAQGDAGSYHEYVRITYCDGILSEDVYSHWEEIYEVNGHEVNYDEYMEGLSEPFHDGRVFSDDTNYILGISPAVPVQSEVPDYNTLLTQYSAILDGSLSIYEASIDLRESGLQLTSDALPRIDENGYMIPDDSSSFYYTFFDINDDGSDELIIREDTRYESKILDIFTLKNNIPTWLICGAYRSYVEVCEDGIIRQVCIGGAEANTYNFYAIQSGSLSLVETAEENWGEYFVNGETCNEAAFENAVNQHTLLSTDNLEWIQIG